MNYMVADGLERDGHIATAARIVADSLKLIEVGGFSGIFRPDDRRPLRRPGLHLDGGDGAGVPEPRRGEMIPDRQSGDRELPATC
ncbi:MAG: hypothetical protein R3D59_11710 [Paracoccaceae bacterium]